MPIEICICPKGRITGLTSNVPPSLLSPNFEAPGVPSINSLAGEKSFDLEHLMKSEISRFKSKPLSQRKAVAEVNEAVGPEVLLALSDFYDHQLDGLPHDFFEQHHKGVLGASVGAMGHRLSKLQITIKNYQIALENVRQAYRSKMPKAEVMKFERAARKIHTRLNTEFQSEISKRLASARARKANIWNNADRGINLAKDSRTTKPIQISSARELRTLNKFAGATKLAGNGLLLLDVHSRASGVRNTFESGGNWEKQALQETVGFSAGFAAGSAVVPTAYAAGVAIALAFTPIGWAVVIGVGVAATAALVVGGTVDFIGKGVTGAVYDMSSQLN